MGLNMFILSIMKSVADDLRAELREETNRLSLDERIALALRALIGAAASP